MDTSKEYIKMCEKAEEIQEILDCLYYRIQNVFAVREKRKQCIHEEDKLFIPYSYDKLYCERCGKKLEEYEATYIDTYRTKPFAIDKEIKKFIWLPRQDQLQEMVKSKAFSYYHLWCKMYQYFSCSENPYGVKIGLMSMEQLWLAFVMREKYHKTWNGEDWVEERL